MDEKSKIIKVRKDADGDIIDVMIENGDIYSLNEAIVIAKYGLLEGVAIERAENGIEYIQDIDNNNEDINKLPLF